MTQREIRKLVSSVIDIKDYPAQCHVASLQIVKSGVLGPSRVARGTCRGVGGQHSWVILGDNCYDDAARIVDPTLWSYDPTVSGLWIGSYRDGLHRPHGKGSIFAWGKPARGTGEIISLAEAALLSQAAEDFLDLLGPLDREGWMQLAHAPVEGWPAAEIIAAMYHTPQLIALLPIDVVGMVTDLNPSGLYL